MSTLELKRRIKNVSGKIHTLVHDITALECISIAHSPESYSEIARQAAIESESIANSLRRIIFDTTNIPRAEYLMEAAKVLNIYVCESDGMVDISIPCLIPKRNKRATGFIADPLHMMLNKFIKERQFPFEPFVHCVICITHVYDKSLPAAGRIRDPDNIEMKEIIDAICSSLLTDDNGILCDIYSTSELENTDMTRISIMSKDMFPAWILRHKNTP